jgi:hypothetical protein
MSSLSQIRILNITEDLGVGTDQVATVDQLSSVGNTIGSQAFVEETNRLYIWNGQGWYNIALINTTPTWDSNGQPAATYELSADSPQTVTTITLAASDPEGFPINYSYVTGGSMDSIGTISQDSSVFTITPKTEVQAPDGGTGSITFRASDGINILPYVSSFTLNFISIIDDSKYTTLLATADGTSDNNNITDSSSNNHTITVSGDAHAGTFSPYRSGGYSTYFDGNGDYLEVPQSSNSSSFGTGEFTVEFWFKPSEAGSTVFFIDFRGSANSGFQIFRRSTNFIRVRGLNQTTLIDGTTSISDFNTWYHICVHRNSSNELKLFINGTQDGGTVTGHTTDYAHPTSGNWLIGKQYNSTSYPNGYMRDVRIVKGTAITPTSGGPTERLEAVTNTTLLTCHLPYISDGSTNAHTITVNGNVSTKPFSPYDNLEYSATDHGGSVYFDGTGDRLQTSAGKIPSGTTNFTVSCWFYSTRSSTNEVGGVFGQGFGSGGRVGIFLYGGTNTPIKYSVDSNDTDTGVFALRNVWYFVELQVTSSTAKMFINGVEESSKSLSGYSAPNTDLTIGNLGSSWTNNLDWTGYISDFLVQIGTPSGSSTVPTSSRSSSGVELHIKGTDASIIDKSQSGNLKMFGNSTGSTTQVKFAGSKSMYFAGSLHDKVIAYAARDVDIPNNGEYTFEAWCYFNSVSGVIHMLSSGDVTNRIAFELRNSKLAAMVGGSVIQSGSQVLSTGQWYHLAISRVTGSPYSTTRFFVNGNLDQTATNYQQSFAIGGFNEWIIGSPSPNNIGNGYNEVTGYMQDVRFTEGLARYTASFTPPTASLEG